MKESKLNQAVQVALSQGGRSKRLASGLSVIEVKGFGRQKGHT